MEQEKARRSVGTLSYDKGLAGGDESGSTHCPAQPTAMSGRGKIHRSGQAARKVRSNLTRVLRSRYEGETE